MILIFGRSFLAGITYEGRAFIRKAPAPLLNNKTNQYPIVLLAVCLTPKALWNKVWVLLGDALIRFRAARCFRLFDFENGWEVGNISLFGWLFHADRAGVAK